MYTLKIGLGALTIRPCDASGCELWLNDVCIHSCGSASEAAQLVAERQTGHGEVDCERGPLPHTIEGWRWLSVVNVARWESLLNVVPSS